MVKTVTLPKGQAAQYRRLRTQQKRHESFARDLINEAKKQFWYKRAVLRNLARLQRYDMCSPEMDEHLTAAARGRHNRAQRALEHAQEQMALVAVCRADQEEIVCEH